MKVNISIQQLTDRFEITNFVKLYNREMYEFHLYNHLLISLRSSVQQTLDTDI